MPDVSASPCILQFSQVLHGSSKGSANSGHMHVLLLAVQMMMPNESFVEYVTSGEYTGSLEDEDMCSLMRIHC